MPGRDTSDDGVRLWCGSGAACLRAAAVGLELSIGRVVLRYGASTVLLIPTSKRVLGRRTVVDSVVGMSVAARDPSWVAAAVRWPVPCA